MHRFASPEQWRHQASQSLEAQYRAIHHLETTPHLPNKVETILLAANIAVQNSVSGRYLHELDHIAHDCNVLTEFGIGYLSTKQIVTELRLLEYKGMIISDSNDTHRYFHRHFVPLIPQLFVYKDGNILTRRRATRMFDCTEIIA